MQFYPHIQKILKVIIVLRATKSKIKIYEKHISVDNFVELIKNEKEKKLKEKINEILTPN